MSYWDTLDRARNALDAGRFREAEDLYRSAVAARGRSPRRVFFSESLVDGARRTWATMRRQPRDTAGPGRWEAADAAFSAEFLDRAEVAVREALQRADLRPEDAAQTSQPLLASALYLVVASDICPSEPTSAVPLLKGLMRTARHTGQAFDADLLRADLPLSADDRLWLARTGDDLLASAAAEPQPGGFATAAWARTLLDLLAPEYFPGSERVEEERRWWAAGIADRHLAAPAAAVDLYREYLEMHPLPGPRPDQARVRCVEMLGNVTGSSFAVPRYRDARAIASPPVVPGSPEAERLREALAAIEARRPADRSGEAWCAAGADGGLRVTFVMWWGEAPVDVATWQAGDAPAAIAEFLEPAAGRMLWAGAGPPAGLAAAVPVAACGWRVEPFLATLLEPRLPRGSWSPDARWQLALARSAAWRETWHPHRGHPRLVPPASDGRLAAAQAGLEPIITAALLWLVCLRRIDEADPALRAGLGELGRRGDPAAAFLHDCAVLGSPAKAALDVGFAPWTLPVLWTRPDPLPSTSVDHADDVAARSDLAGNDVVVVATGHPGAVLTAWSDRDRRWRVVLDRLDRLGDLHTIARGAYGPVTVVPAGGEVHDLAGALAWLEDLAGRSREGDAAMLAVFHWIRLVETHNGDLLDHERLRGRLPGEHTLYDLYRAGVSQLPRRVPCAGDDPAQAGWSEQFAQRVRKSGLVVGAAADLTEDAAQLDARWGVFDGSGASWVFLDSAAVHWQLWQRAGRWPASLHALLATRGARHASLLLAGTVMTADLRRALDGVLAPYGRPYHLALTDVRPTRLRLVGRGPVPDAHLQLVEAWTAAAAYLNRTGVAPALVLAPRAGLAAEFWQAVAAGVFGRMPWSLVASLSDDIAGARLVVPLLESLDDNAPPGSAAVVVSAPNAWRAQDEQRRARARERRALAAMEINALLALPVASVEVLDGRWWRLADSDWEPAAARAQLAPQAELIDLPASDEGASQRLRGDVAPWLAERGRVPGELPGWQGAAPGTTGEEAHDPVSGVHLDRRDAVAVWRRLAAWLLRGWEMGMASRRLVIIADEPPLHAADVVAALDCPGATVPPAMPTSSASGSAVVPWAPLVWLRPADVARLGRDTLASLRPDAVLVADLAAWLPIAGPARPETTQALRWIADCGASIVALAGAGVSPAWELFLARQLGAGTPPPAPGPGDWATLKRSDALPLEIDCPHCEHRGAPVGDAVCRRCGFDLAAYAASHPGIVQVACTQGTLRAFAQRRDLGRERPLDLWAQPTLTPRDVLAAEVAAQSATTMSTGELRLADGRRWRLRAAKPGAAASGHADSVVIGVPHDPGTLVPVAPLDGVDTLTLAYATVGLGDPLATGEVAGAQRLLRLLREGTPAIVAAERGAWPAGSRGDATVPLLRLEHLAGLEPASLQTSVGLLRWASRLAASEVVAPALSAPVPRLWVGGPYAAIEHAVAELRRDLTPALAQFLADATPGAWHDIVWPVSATDDDRRRRERVDRLLHLASRLPAPGQGDRLGYRASVGAYFSDRRWLQWRGSRLEAESWLDGQLDAFLDWSRQVLAAAVAHDDGYAVAGDPVAGDPWWRSPWLVWGQELGCWHVAGVTHADQVDLAELDRLREIAEAAEHAPAARLLVDLAAERSAWRRVLREARPGGVVAAPVPHIEDMHDAAPPVRRSWLRRGSDGDPVTAASRAVAELAAGHDRALLILAGPAGTGRHEALLAGLDQATRVADAPDAVTVWCPDAASAAHLHLACLARRQGWQLDLRVPGPASDRALGAADTAPGGHRVTVVTEVQRLSQEVRYRLQEEGRRGGLILTADPHESLESWDTLFLTTPRPEQVRYLELQRAQTRRLWEETAPLIGRVEARNRTRRREKGALHSRRAVNLDECVSAVAAEVEAGRLGPSCDLVVPLGDDAAFLGRMFAARGWLAVFRQELDELLLPGTLEFICAAHDVAAASLGAWPGTAADGPPPLLGQWVMTPTLADGYPAWVAACGDGEARSVGALWEVWRRTPWGRAGAGHPAARVRTTALVNTWSREELPTFLDRPLWAAWRDSLGEALGQDALAADRPVIRLATTAQPPGGACVHAVYVCAGTESDQDHYRVLGHVTDGLLVLWQERSPLPTEADETPPA